MFERGIMMKCGCAASATCEGKPSCPVHNCLEQDPNPPSLEGRTATCCYGHHAAKPSDTKLPFFQYEAKKAQDTYYCGCYGWD